VFPVASPVSSPAYSLSARRETWALIALMLVKFAGNVDFTIMMPLAPQLMREFQFSPTHVGILISAYAFGAGISSLLAASLADRFDRRSSLLVAVVGLLGGTLGCALCSGFYTLLAARVVAGLFGGMLTAFCYAIVGDLVPLERRGRALSIVETGYSLATIAGVPMGLLFASGSGWRMPFVVLTGMCLAVLLMSWKVLPSMRAHLVSASHTPMLESYRELLAVPNHWRAFLMMALLVGQAFLVLPYLAPSLVLNVGLSSMDLAWIYLAGGAAALVTRPYIGRLSDSLPQAQVLGGLILCSFAPILLISHTLSLGLGWQMLFSVLFFTFVPGRFIPGAALATSSTVSRMRGRVMSFAAALQNLSSGSASLIAGAIMDKGAHGELLHYSVVGYLSCGVGVLTYWAARRVRVVS
jgi:predicted MFS family arabinose efflux permease